MSDINASGVEHVNVADWSGNKDGRGSPVRLVGISVKWNRIAGI